MILLRQSTAATLKLGPFVDSTDGVTAETGLTIAQADIRLSKNGGAFAQTNNATGASHDENGYYGVPLDTTDTGTLGRLKVAISESGALPVWVDCMVVPANEYDSLVLGTDALDVEVASMAANAVTATAIATDAITAAKIAADAIGSSELAATAVSEIVGGVWGQTVPGIYGAGTAGKKLGDLAPLNAAGVRAAVGLASANLDTQLSGLDTKIDTIDGVADAILLDTDELQGNQGDWATATGFSTLDAAGVRTAVGLASADLDTQLSGLDTKIDTIDGVVDAVLVDTGTTLPAQVAALNNISQAQVNAQVDAALADYDGPTKAEMDAAFTEVKGAGFASTDTLEAIRDRGDAAWVTGGGGGGGGGSSASDIWGYDLETGFSAGQILRGVGAVMMGRTMILEDGQVVFRSLDDDRNAAAMTLAANGVRSNIVLLLGP